MELAPGSRAKNQYKIKNAYGGRMGLDSETLLVVKLPDSKVMRVVSRSVFLALIFLTMPCIGSILRGSNDSATNLQFGTFNSDDLNFLVHNLAEEGLLTKNEKALIVRSGIASGIDNLRNFDANQIVMTSAMEGQSSFLDKSFDFVLVSDLVDVKFVDRVLKVGGIVAFPLSNDQANALQQKTNYKIVYVRRYSSTIIAMKKTGPVGMLGGSSSMKRRLLRSETEAKKTAALKEFEDVLLEPPRWPMKDLEKYSRKMKFLPQFLGDSLEVYRRRVFVNVGIPEENKGVNQWFHRNYPKMQQEFEVYDIDVEPEEAAQQSDVSDWLTKNVSEEEYVVMKAEAEVVEEMISKGTIRLVDELFLECNNQWWKAGTKSKTKRAYWECLSLYGRVKDEGVAVHQWWGLKEN